MMGLYVGPVNNPCLPGQASTFTTELGQHCVDAVSPLAATGEDPSLLAGGIITTLLFMLAGGILFAYNHLRNKD